FQKNREKSFFFICHHKRPQIVKEIFSNKSLAGSITAPDFKIYYKAIVIKRYDIGRKPDTIDQWNRIESSEVTRLCGQFIHNKAAKNIQWGEDSLLNEWCWENWIARCKRIKMDSHIIQYQKNINSKWIKDLNLRPETIKHREGNIGESFRTL
ncbi:LORF2 protein, partial [Crocuta crocuta]